MKPIAAVAASLVLVAGVGGWWALQTAPGTSRSEPGCSFSPGDLWAVNLVARSTSRLSPQTLLTGKATALSVARAEALEARWHFRVEADEPGGWRMAAVLEPRLATQDGAPLSPELLQSMQRPFLLRVAADCRLAAMAFDSQTPAEVSQRLRVLLQSTEVVRALPDARGEWTASQSDGVGTAQVRYSPGGLQWVKRRERYTQVHQPTPKGQVTADIVSSEAQVELDAHGWPSRYDGKEQVRLRNGGALFAEIRAEVQLTPAAADEAAIPRELAVNTFRWRNADAPMLDREGEPMALPAPAPELQPMDTVEALRSFAERLAGQDEQALREGAVLLAQYLKVHPERTAEVLAALREGRIDKAHQSALFLSLELAGTPEAERGLREVVTQPADEPVQRMQAAVALSNAPAASAEAARALQQVAMESVRPEEADRYDVSSTALLALGTLGHRLEHPQPEVAAEIDAALAARLSAPAGPEALASALDAVGNRRSEAFIDSIAHAARHEEPLVRSHAADALRRLANPRTQALVRDWLGQESHPKVRVALYGLMAAWAEQGVTLEDSLLAVAVTRLPAEEERASRAAAIRALGTLARSGSTVARGALVAQFHREPIVELKVLIGQFVRAADLN